MSETLTLDLTEKQRETLLRGLRFVRSTVMLDMDDHSPEDEARRDGDLQEIESLVETLNAAEVVDSSAKV